MWPALYRLYHLSRQKTVVRQQRQNVIRYLLDDTDQVIAAIHEHNRELFK